MSHCLKCMYLTLAQDASLAAVQRLEDGAAHFQATLAARAQHDSAAMAAEMEARNARAATVRTLEEARVANAARAERLQATSERFANLKVGSMPCRGATVCL